ncbi:MAG: SIS domain-containing protein, partial [Deltaproteobacteria bacterium]|nr:SIS domain-containing protein [Deltaproteobacteria bacterium]
MTEKISHKIPKTAVLDVAKRVIDIEASALTALKSKLGDSFIEAVELILATEGKVVITGMGKSGLICQKIASTFASTGTSAFFLHPAEGAHGDLGVLSKDDILIAVSNSGESEEIVTTLP